MRMTQNDIMHAALALPKDDRATLAVRLLDSLHAPADPAVEAAWAEEIERRLADLDAGRTRPLPWPQVREDLRSIIG